MAEMKEDNLPTAGLSDSIAVPGTAAFAVPNGISGVQSGLRFQPPRMIQLGILTDTEIAEEVEATGMIEPFVDHQIRAVTDVLGNERRVISYGLSSFGYDVRLDRSFKVFTNLSSGVIDPKRPSQDHMVAIPESRIYKDEDGSEYVILPPHGYMNGHTPEYFKIPRNMTVICVGKSTYARSGVIINVTPIEAGFEGQVVIEIFNATNLPQRVYVGEGIAQFIFWRGLKCKTSYADRGGKYQGQTGVTDSRV